MFVGNDYYIAWILYFIAVLVTAIIYLRLTLWVPRHIRVFTMLFFVSVFIAPAPVIQGEQWVAPALILVPFEILSGSKSVELAHLFDPLLDIQLLTVLLFLLYWLIQRYLFPGRKPLAGSDPDVQNDADSGEDKIDTLPAEK